MVSYFLGQHDMMMISYVLGQHDMIFCDTAVRTLESLQRIPSSCHVGSPEKNAPWFPQPWFERSKVARGSSGRFSWSRNWYICRNIFTHEKKRDHFSLEWFLEANHEKYMKHGCFFEITPICFHPFHFEVGFLRVLINLASFWVRSGFQGVMMRYDGHILD